MTMLRKVRWWFRLRGVALVVSGAVLALFGVTAADEAGPLIALGGIVAAHCGLYLALVLPRFLRRPEDIERIDANEAGLHIVMENGRSYRLAVRPSRRDALKDALEKQGGANRLRARVVQR